jgi:hypothetical protein
MAVIIKTDKPKMLLSSIKEAIRSGTITDWICDSDGDFTLSSDQWKHKAWLRPKFTDEGFTLNILAPKQTKLSKVTYAVYHARIIEMLLTHFDNDFRHARATAMPVSPDIVS